MIDYETLNQALMTLSSSEIFHKKHPDFEFDYSKLSKVVKNGFSAYVFSEYPKSEDNHSNSMRKFAIQKHTRFSYVPMHIHSYIELSYVYSGSFPQTIMGQDIILEEGQLCLLDTAVPHSIGRTSEDDIIINLLISKEYFSSSFISRLSQGSILASFFINAISEQKQHNNFIIFKPDSHRRISLFFKELLCEYYNPGISNHEMMECYLLLIFSELLNIYESSAVKHELHLTHTPIISVLKYINTNFVTCTLKSTADFFNLHPNYLTALLRKETGKSYKQLVQEQKLTSAAHLLTSTNEPILEIANQVGYKNISFFYQIFKEKYNVTPQEYRKQN